MGLLPGDLLFQHRGSKFYLPLTTQRYLLGGHYLGVVGAAYLTVLPERMNAIAEIKKIIDSAISTSARRALMSCSV